MRFHLPSKHSPKHTPSHHNFSSCFLHRRLFTQKKCKLIDSSYADEIEEHRLLMNSSANDNQMDSWAAAVRKEWTDHGEHAFVKATDNLTVGVHKRWFKAATGLVGTDTEMQAEERGHRDHHKIVDQNASHMQVRSTKKSLT